MKLNAKQSEGVEAILTTPSLAEAAARCGSSERTLRRWRLEVPAFAAALEEARRSAMGEARDALRFASVAAVSVLRSVAGDVAAPPAARLTAARLILELGFRAEEVTDLVERIEALERGALGGKAAVPPRRKEA